MRLMWMILAAALACNTGCATKALLKAANSGGGEHVAGEVRVLSASRSGSHAYLCLQRTSPGTAGETYSLLIPTAESRDFHFRENDTRQPVIRVSAEQLMRGACKSMGKPIPVIEIDDASRLTLQNEQSEAVYVQYAQGSLRNLGYVSANPLYDSRTTEKAQHGYALDMQKSGLFSFDSGSKRPYLLVLLPVSVATDVVVGSVVVSGAVVVAFAKSFIDDCSRQPQTKGCKGP